MDASLIANEVIDSMRKRKERGVLSKLDIEKAYDRINWNFLLGVLQKMAFGWRWLRWCITTASFSVLVNGCPTRFFKSSRVLRQRDLLSLYLFVLGMEVFSILVDKAATKGFISGYKIANINGEEVHITHLLFADDMLVFYEDSKD